jgi:hypothetical protein
VTTTKQPVRPGPSVAEVTSGLDARVLGLASLASVLGGIVASAFGGGPQATLICAAISPWVSAFLTHPGPHRVRRVSAVLVFAFLVASCRKAFAAVRTAARLPGAPRREAGGKPADAGVPAVDAARAHLTRAWLGQVSLTAAASFGLAVTLLTVAEAIRGQAVAAERDTTFFSGAPLPTGPTLRVPDGVIERAGKDTAARVTYRVVATDAIGNPLVPACDPPSGARFRLGRTRVECSATDAAGDRARAHFVVTVLRGGSPPPVDHKQPTLTVPDDFSHDATGDDGARVTYAASARDTRDGALTPDCEPASGSLFGLGRTRVLCTATDAAGNTAHAGFAITVIRAGGVDRTPPVITVPAAIETRATSRDGAKVTYDASASDNRDGALNATCEPPSGSLFAIGTTTVTCSAQDAANNEATKSFTVTVARTGHPDLTPPDITVPDPIRTRATSKDGATVTYHASASDNRDRELKPRCDPPSGSVFSVGKTTVICSARDAAGNEDTKTFTVTVISGGTPPPNRGAERADPTLTVPDPIRVPAASKDGATVTYDVSATDDRNRPLKPSCDPASGSVFAFGKTAVECSAQDSAGNTASKSFTVTVFDGTPPVITVPDTIEEYGFSGGTPVSYEVSATDDRDGAVNPTCKPPSGSDFPPGPTTVNCSARDSAGNEATKNFTVIVVFGGA